MPTRALRPCSRRYEGCLNYSTGGPCANCKQREDRARGTTTARGYGALHRKRRAVVLSRQPLCLACQALGRTTPATVDDHIVPISHGGSVSDLDNHQALCAPCHNLKRSAESRGRQMRVQDGRGLVDAGPLRRGRAA